MKHFNEIETFIPNGKMLGPITQFLFNQNVGLNLAPLRLGTNFQIKFNFLMSFPGILVSHSHSQKLGRQFSFPFPSPKFGNGLSYSCSHSPNPKSHFLSPLAKCCQKMSKVGKMPKITISCISS